MKKVLLAALVALAACGGGDEEEKNGPCTLIACFHGLLVTVANPPMEPYRVEALAAGQTTPQVRDCSSGGSCFILFSDFFPDSVTVQIVLTASGTVVRNTGASPNYVTRQPNGPRCGTCRNATVAL